MIELYILGAPELRDEAGRLKNSFLSGSKRLALLSYLTLERPDDFKRRDTLLPLFWPESSQKNARNALSNIIYQMRDALGDDIVVNRGNEEIKVGRLWCDVHAFEETIDKKNHEKALDHYRGDLLEGLHVPDASVEFEQWLDLKRKELHRKYLDLLQSRAEEAERGGNLEEAVQWWLESHHESPFDTEVVRRLMVALTAADRKTEALEVGQDFARKLHDELGNSKENVMRELTSGLDEAARNIPPSSSTVDKDQTAKSSTEDRSEDPEELKKSGFQSKAAIAAGLALVCLAALGLWWYSGFGGNQPATGRESAPSTESKHKQSVAVLPFQDFSPDKNQQWFADGLTEEILTSLARIDGLRVPARTSSFAFKDKNIPVRLIADSLQVEHIVEGSVRRFGDRFRISVQLVHAEEGDHLWSKNYSQSVDSIFNVQQKIATNIVDALDIYLDEKQRKRMFNYGTQNVKAYEAMLKGKQLLNKSHSEGLNGIWKANKLFDKAIRLDSTFADAYHLRTDALTHLIFDDISPPPGDSISAEQAFERFHENYRKAIRHTTYKGARLFYRFSKAYFSNNWEDIPEIARKINNSPEAAQYYVHGAPGWATTGLSATGYAELNHRLNKYKLQQDPLSNSYHFLDRLALLALDKPGQVLQSYEPNTRQDSLFYVRFVIFNDQIEKAKSILAKMDSTEKDLELLKYKLLVGMKKMDKVELDQYVKEFNSPGVEMWLYFAAGYDKKVNRLAGKLDSSMLGCRKGVSISMGTVIPFDLKATPNLKRCLEQAEIELKNYSLAGHQVKKVVQKELK